MIRAAYSPAARCPERGMPGAGNGPEKRARSKDRHRAPGRFHQEQSPGVHSFTAGEPGSMRSRPAPGRERC